MVTTYSRVAIGCDHTAIEAKNELILFLKEIGITVIDEGNSDDNQGILFLNIAERTALKVQQDKKHSTGGILICGNGVGMAIAANKIPGIRAAVCNELYTAQYAKRDMHLNVLCMGVRIISVHLMKEIIKVWLKQENGDGRFAKRVEALMKMEQRYLNEKVELL